MEFLPSSSCVNTTVRMHHMNADKTYREKTRWEMHKNVTSCTEQILRATLHETGVWPLTSHL